MASIPSPTYFRNTFSIWSASVGFPLSSLDTQIGSSRVTSLCNPFELLLTLFYTSAFASAQAVIPPSNSALNVLLVVGVPSLRQCSTTTSLFALELLPCLFIVWFYCCSHSGACLSRVFAYCPCYPSTHLVHPAIKLSLVLFTS